MNRLFRNLLNRKYFLLIAIIVRYAVCLGNQIQMTTTISGEIEIRIAGAGAVTVDWGDKTAAETHTLENYADIMQFLSDDAEGYIYKHVFSNNAKRNIVLSGDNITHLYCSGIQLTGIDVSDNIALKGLSCDNNQLTGLNLNANTALTFVICDDNRLTDLNLSNNKALVYVDCSSNKLTKLDVSHNKALSNLICNNNLLTNLNVNANTALSYLICHENNITSLNVSANVELVEFWCFKNQLTQLDVSKNVSLVQLNCNWNKLTGLDVSKNTALNFLGCSENLLDDVALDKLFGTLHNKSGQKTMYIGGNPGLDDCDRTIAADKGWTVVYY